MTTPTITESSRTPAPTPSATATRTQPLSRLIGVEMRKMFDTRAGLWMMASVAIFAVIASAALIAFAPETAIVYGNFAAAVGVPMSVLLPIIAILSVTSEYSQRT